MSERIDTWVSDGNLPPIIFSYIGRCFYEYAKPMRPARVGEYYLNPRNKMIAICDDRLGKTPRRIVRPTHYAVEVREYRRGAPVVIPTIEGD